MKNSLKDKLCAIVELKGSVSFEELAAFTNEEGYKISNMERRMRELCATGQIIPAMGTSRRGTQYIKSYHLKEKKPEISYLPDPLRPNVMIEVIKTPPAHEVIKR